MVEERSRDNEPIFFSYKRQVGYNIRKSSGIDGVDVVLVTLQFEKITEDLFLVFDDNKQIANVDFSETN